MGAATPTPVERMGVTWLSQLCGPRSKRAPACRRVAAGRHGGSPHVSVRAHAQQHEVEARRQAAARERHAVLHSHLRGRPPPGDKEVSRPEQARASRVVSQASAVRPAPSSPRQRPARRGGRHAAGQHKAHGRARLQRGRGCAPGAAAPRTREPRRPRRPCPAEHTRGSAAGAQLPHTARAPAPRPPRWPSLACALSCGVEHGCAKPGRGDVGRRGRACLQGGHARGGHAGLCEEQIQRLLVRRGLVVQRHALVVRVEQEGLRSGRGACWGVWPGHGWRARQEPRGSRPRPLAHACHAACKAMRAHLAPGHGLGGQPCKHLEHGAARHGLRATLHVPGQRSRAHSPARNAFACLSPVRRAMYSALAAPGKRRRAPLLPGRLRTSQAAWERPSSL
jgi:hypothetical protein